MKNGSITSESTASSQLRMNIATIVLMAIGEVARDRLAVSVTTDWMPPTSLANRLWISPVRVSVKKRSGIALEVAYKARHAGPA